MSKRFRISVSVIVGGDKGAILAMMANGMQVSYATKDEAVDVAEQFAYYSTLIIGRGVACGVIVVMDTEAGTILSSKVLL